MRLLTLNLLNDGFGQKKRLQSAIKQIAALEPDIVTLQEVDLLGGIPAVLKKSFSKYNFAISSRPGHLLDKEGLVLFTKYDIVSIKTVELRKQHRILQLVEIQVDSKTLLVANVHMHWSILSDKNRKIDANQIIGYQPDILAGDFNATPRMGSIKIVSRHYRSAIDLNVSQSTYPSRLHRLGLRAVIRRISIIILGIATHRHLGGWHGMIDYIFLAESVRLKSAIIVFSEPLGDHPGLYASDHLGVLAEIDYHSR